MPEETESEFVFPDEQNRSGFFQTTNWPTVQDAGTRGSPRNEAALTSVCQTYWYPIYYYTRRQGYPPEDAQDLTQAFFARVIEKNYLQAARQEKGKFRSFLLVMLKRFLSDQLDHAQRIKRGGGQPIISLDAEDTEGRYLNEPADNLTPEKAFERRWAGALMQLVLSRLQTESVDAGKGTVFNALKSFLTCEEDKTPCAEAAQNLNTSENNVKVMVHRLRQRYRELLRAEIAHTGATPEQVEEEIRDLFAALA